MEYEIVFYLHHLLLLRTRTIKINACLPHYLSYLEFHASVTKNAIYTHPNFLSFCWRQKKQLVFFWPVVEALYRVYMSAWNVRV